MSKVTCIKKSIALFLTFILIFMSSVIASAATVTLSKSNITEYPTVVYKTDDEGNPLTLYYGMKDGDVVSLAGGKVEYNGAEVPGHFELTNPDKVQTLTGTIRADITFYPDDTDMYTGFSATRVREVTYPVNVLPLVLADPENDPVVASDINAQDTLSKSTFSGGMVINPLDPDDPNVENGYWQWVNPTTVVTESGSYEAMFIVGSSKYGSLRVNVNVNVKGTVTETEIINVPEIADYAYDGVTTWGDLINIDELVAVDKNTKEPVSGMFSHTYIYKLTDKPAVGENSVIITFTPDSNEYLPSQATVTFNVTKGTPSWKDGITPVVTVPYGTTVVAETFHNLRYDGTLVADETLNFNLCDAEGNILFDGVRLDCGTYTDYQLRAASKSTQSNWQPALLPITIVVEPTEAEISVVYNSKTNQLNVSASSRYLYGTFDIYIDGQLIFDNAVIERYLDTMRFLASWLPDNISQNLTHDIKVVYNPAENDNAYIANDFEGTFTFEAERTINETEKSIYFYKGNSSFTPGEDQLFAGEEIRVLAGMPDFLYWEITDSKGNDVELEFVKGDMNSKEIIIVMPEFDINIDYVTQTDLDRQEAIEGCGCLCHNDNPIVQFFWRIILFFMNLFHIENVCDCGYPHGS